MNIVFMIGNGFDLNCGMKTSYRDVYAGYCKTKSSSAEIQKFKNRIAGDRETWGDFEVAMCDYMKNFIHIDGKYQIFDQDSFFDCLEDFDKYMIEYLKKQEQGFQQNLNTGSPSTDLALSMNLTKEWNRSTKEFFSGAHLSQEEKSEFERSLELPYNKYNFVTYNFTSTLEFLTPFSGVKNVNIFHPHGMLTTGPTLGMDNIGQLPIDSNKITDDVKTFFIKPEFVCEYYGDDFLRRIRSVIENADLICVFGLSLGISDFRWRNLLLEKAKNGTDIFFFDYNLTKRVGLIPQRKISLERSSKKNLLLSWGISDEDIDMYMENFHMPIGNNIFNFGKIIEDIYKGVYAKAEEVLATV